MILFLLSQVLLDTTETKALIQALAYLNLAPEDLSYNKDWAGHDTFRLPAVKRLLGDPLALPPFADSVRAEAVSCAGDPVRALLTEFSLLDIRVSARDTLAMHRRFKRAEKGKRGPDALLAFLGAAWDEAETHRKRAFSALSEAQIDTLLYYSLFLWADEGDSLSDTLKGCLFREFGIHEDTSWCDDSARVLELSERIDWRELALGALGFAMGVARVIALEDVPEPGEYSAGQWKILVGSPGDDVYGPEATGRYHLILDPGGRDTYLGRPGGAVGFIGRAFSAVVDLAGDDLYSGDRFFSLGAGLLGFGALVDLAGNDVYRGLHGACAAGMWGAGFLVDKGGNDLYEVSGFFGLSAAEFGASYLYEGKGDDVMRLFSCGEAFSSVKGCALLDDAGGNDIYYAGGAYLHKPLLPDNYRAFAQGFSMGLRPEASGGIALLVDQGGNDSYFGEVYSQGCSYWYSLGLLEDMAGDDAYYAVEYAQGAGIHLSVGLLGDFSGNDHYFSRHGPSQGEGHDLSVGFLVDKAGNDDYQVSGGMGVGLTNSVGVFVDAGGNDTYSFTEGIGLGDANRARHTGGVGIFLDLGGQDAYPSSSRARNQRAWIRGLWGVGWDR